MGVSLSTVNRAHMAYDQGGLKALKPKPNGGRKHENMTLACAFASIVITVSRASLAEEKALLARFAKAAGAGEMLNIHDLKAGYEKAIGHADILTLPLPKQLQALYPVLRLPLWLRRQRIHRGRSLQELDWVEASHEKPQPGAAGPHSRAATPTLGRSRGDS